MKETQSSLVGLEPVRRRPGMYIGNPDEHGLETCVMEIMAGCITDFRCGFGDRVNVDLRRDGSISIEDFGRGMDVEIDPEFKRSKAELRIGNIHYDAQRSDRVYFGGLGGVGIPCVCAVSEWMRVTIRKGSKEYSLRAQQGEIVQPLRSKGNPGPKTGMVVTFKPDSQIFKSSIEFDFHALAFRFELLAALNPGLLIVFADRRSQKTEECFRNSFYFPNGLAEFVRRRAFKRALCHELAFFFRKVEGDIEIEAALQFSDTDDRQILSFVNFFPTTGGGAHVEGFLQGLSEALETLRGQARWGRRGFRRKNVTRGMTAILNVKHPNPHYGSRRERIYNRDVYEIAQRNAKASLLEFIAKNPSTLSGILHHMYDDPLPLEFS